MNKFLKLFCGAAVLTTMAACSSDEPNVGPNGPDGNGEVAYMKIQITAPETGTRTTTDGGFVESDLTPKEHKVTAVSFLFFQADGSYAFTVKADDSNFVAADKDDTNAGNGNVEYIGDSNIVILEGVTQNNYPEYVMTILNCPKFEAGQTMQETADKLATFATDFNIGGTEQPEAPFIMTTSSFYGDKYVKDETDKPRHDAQYYVTKLNKSDFMTTLEQAKTNPNPVEIYVERLAAKVELDLVKTSNRFEMGVDNLKYFKLNQTLAGGNDNTSGDNVSDVDLYIRVDGWGLNAIASQSYMSKKLRSEWQNDNFANPYTGWNDANNWRSYWGMAQTYGTYDSGKFTYKPLKNFYNNNQAFDTNNVEYCYENTNAPDNIFTAVTDGQFSLNGSRVGVENARVTHVVLRTKIFEKVSEGVFAPVNELVQYRGILYTADSFKALLLNSLKASSTLNFWRADGTTTDPATGVETTKYKSIDKNDLVMVKNSDGGHKLGEIKVVAKALAAGDKIFERTVEEGTGKVEYKDITSSYEAKLNGLLAGVYAANHPRGTNTADAIYYIPIEHNATTLTQGTPTEAKEAFYGVVRNHWYQLTINSFRQVGHLVFDPSNDETVVIPEGPENPLYYVGAKINILSWKVVKQDVDDL